MSKSLAKQAVVCDGVVYEPLWRRGAWIEFATRPVTGIWRGWSWRTVRWFNKQLATQRTHTPDQHWEGTNMNRKARHKVVPYQAKVPPFDGESIRRGRITLDVRRRGPQW